MSTIVDKPLESQIRPLTSLATVEEKREVVAEAVKEAPNVNGKPVITGRSMKAAVQKVKARRAAPPSAPPSPGKPWAEFEQQIDGMISELRGLGRRLGEILGADAETKQLRTEWARGYSHSGTVGAVNQIVRTLEQGMPAELSDRPPGFRTAREAAIAKGGK